MPHVNYQEIVEVAALLALDGDRSPESSRVSARGVHDALRLSRMQTRLWLAAAGSSNSTTTRGQRALCELIEEVLISEPRVRILAALLARGEGARSPGGVSRRLLLDHAEAKRVVLTELLDGSLPMGAFVRINTLRRRMERWTDLLLGVAGAGIDAEAFGFDEQRVDEHRRTGDGDEPLLGRLIFSGLRQAVPRREVEDPVRSRAHFCLHECVLHLLSPVAPRQGGASRTGLQRRIFADHLTTDRPASRLPLRF